MHTMMAKPVKTLEFHYPMIKFVITNDNELPVEINDREFISLTPWSEQQYGPPRPVIP